MRAFDATPGRGLFRPLTCQKELEARKSKYSERVDKNPSIAEHEDVAEQSAHHEHGNDSSTEPSSSWDQE